VFRQTKRREKDPFMDIRKVTDSFAVSPQIRPEDVQTLADEGYTTIICNRPDDEEFGQPLFESLAAQAKALGLDIHHLPIASGMFGPQHISQMAELIENSSGKVFAYCRSGTRSIMLWAFQEVTKRPRDEVLALADAAGYDLSQQI
jgi:uncharacterized protein (TIGR01244 family)